MISRSNGRYFIFDASSTKRGEGEEREEEGGKGGDGRLLETSSTSR